MEERLRLKKEYQILTEQNTKLAQDYIISRMENMVSVEDNKNIFNLEPTHIQDVITSINKIRDKALFDIYTLQPPRRVEDFQFMKLTTEQDPTKLANLITWITT